MLKNIISFNSNKCYVNIYLLSMCFSYIYLPQHTILHYLNKLQYTSLLLKVYSNIQPSIFTSLYLVASVHVHIFWFWQISLIIKKDFAFIYLISKTAGPYPFCHNNLHNSNFRVKRISNKKTSWFRFIKLLYYLTLHRFLRARVNGIRIKWGPTV